ncbi:MAG: hypothetical protein JKY65_03660, partial [Planctomycetes bacterium]|nr:hypothetical protein [Planctomycetota bacterium]
MSGTGAPQAMADLAARYGLVTPDSRKRIQEQLRSGVAAGQPTSLTRILIAEGQAPEVMAAILASGEHASAVLCDCCSAPISQHQIHERLEVPCPSCGSLLMGFRVFAKPPTARRKSASTARYGEVLPVPAGKSVTERVGAALPAGTREEENSETSPYGIVLLPTPLLERAFGDLLATDTSTKGAQKPPPA